MSTVTKYLDSKKIDYTLDGMNAIACCPFCKQGNKWGIHIESGLYSCFRGSCAAKGNMKTLRKHFGDSVVEEMQKSNLEDDEPVTSTTVRNKVEAVPDVEAAHKLLLSNDEILNYLNDERGISLDTVKAAKLGLGKRKFSDGKISQALMFPYFAKGKCVGVKYRSLPPDPKDFRYTAGRDVGLYREDAVVKDMDSLIITEGENDALTLLQHGYTNVVGVSGANSKKVDWSDLLDLPKKLYLVMDNDSVGVEGAKTFATRFGIDRFNIVNIPQWDLVEPVEDKHGTRTTIKDANDFFQAGYTKEQFDELLSAARPFDIDGITTMESSFDHMIEMHDKGLTNAFPYLFKWPSVNARAKGCKKGDLIPVLAAPKCGKTSWCLNQCEFMAETYGLNIHFSCFEMDDTELIPKWTAMKLEVEEESLTRAQKVEGRRIVLSRPNTFIFSRPHPKSLDDYVDLLTRAKRRYATDVLVIDNFQYLVDLTIGKNEGGNRPNYMSRVSKTIKALAKDLDVVIFLISQPRNVDEGAMVTVNHSEGSGTLKADADLFFTFNRAAEAKMKMEQMDSMGKFETDQSHSDNMYVEVGLSRRSKGGFCTLKIDGAKSLIREFDATETTSGQRKAMINGIQIIDENETVAA